MYDIGFQALSRMVASGADIKVLVLDTQVYSNTGGQASTASFGGQVTKLSAFGKALARPARAAQGARPDPHGPRRRVRRADDAGAPQSLLPRGHGGERVSRARRSSIVYTACMPEHGIADDAATPAGQARGRLARLPAVHLRPASRASRSPSGCRSRAIRRCARTGRRLPDGTPVDFLTFARTEGRFAPHFAADGTPTTEICATQLDRLGNWRTLQELAGSIPGRSPGMEE